MLYDRPYMQADPWDRPSRVLIWLVIVNLLIFVLQNLLTVSTGSDYLVGAFALTMQNLSEGKIHSFLTHGFLHANIWHVGINMLIFYFMGRTVEPLLGTRHFLYLYFGGIIAGGLLWFFFHAFSATPSILLGASGGVIAVLIFFCLTRPEEKVDFLLFFLIPVTLKPKWITRLLIGFSLFGLFFYELPATGGGETTAHSAHLGGILGAYLFFHLLYLGKSWVDYPGSEYLREEPKRRSPKGGSQPAKALRLRSGMSRVDREQLKSEVDRVLDKINENGFGSLTEEEKQLLDRAREILNK